VATCKEGEEDDVQRCRLYAFSAAMLISCLPVSRMEGANARNVPQVEYYLHRR
jgi:hypothetical protein